MSLGWSTAVTGEFCWEPARSSNIVRGESIVRLVLEKPYAWEWYTRENTPYSLLRDELGVFVSKAGCLYLAKTPRAELLVLAYTHARTL